MKLKSLFRRLNSAMTGGTRLSRRLRRRSCQGTTIQPLESRTLLASVMDSGNGTLSIDLSAGERLKVVSNGTGYSFVSTTQTFTDNGVDDPDDFTGFDTDTLGLIGLAQYTSVSITDSGAGASVQLLDSGVNAYVHDFEITLDDGAFGQSIVFDGGAHFGNHSLTANSDRSIQLFTGTNLTTVDGDIILKGALCAAWLWWRRQSRRPAREIFFSTESPPALARPVTVASAFLCRVLP